MGRIFVIVTIVIFTLIGLAAWMKDSEPAKPQVKKEPIEISMGPVEVKANPAPQPKPVQKVTRESVDLPNADRVDKLFSTSGSNLPFVQSIEYQSRVPWQKGRPAWISDYARHYKTSRHFIARSLNGGPNYFEQNIRNGDLINIYHPDQDTEFHLVVDNSRCKMWLYAYEKGSDQNWLLKRYDVTLGEKNENKASGLLTPLGNYTLGDRIAIYTPGIEGYYKGKKAEMIQVFGTRWIPFEKALPGATAPAKSFGIHGVPWEIDPATGELKEDTSSIGEYESDGCIRMRTDDIEELFAILVRRPKVTIHLVTDFFDAKIPGKPATR